MLENRINIMDIPFLNVTKQEFLRDFLYKDIEQNNKRFIVTANPEIVMYANNSEKYYKTMQEADYIIPDGIGIVVASKLIKNPLKDRVPGFEVMTELIEYATEKQLSCYFLGAKKHVIEKMIHKLRDLHPNLNIAGYHHGYIDIDEDQLANEIKRLKPDLIFVALGFPNQEYWISNHINKFDKGLFMGVGGSFDVIAGEVKRAPKMWIKLNLEWLYRVVKQPFRLKRLIKVFQFFLKMLFKRK